MVKSCLSQTPYRLFSDWLDIDLLRLIGISWYATRQRIREISIRKIHGATSRQIVLLLNKTILPANSACI